MTGQFDEPNRDDSVRAADDALAVNLRGGFEAYRADRRGIAREKLVQVAEGLAAIIASIDDVNTDTNTAAN